MSVLEDARAVLATGPICDACLGRVFADRSFGLGNDERGRALRVAVALDEDEPFEPAEECWVCEGICERHDKLAEQVVEALEGVEFDTYQVGTRVPPLVEENDLLLREDAGLDPDAGEQFKSAFNREVGKRVGGLTGSAVDFERPDVVALLNLERGDVDIQVNPAFVYGRYRKLERDVPQTEWPCRECGGGGKEFDPDEGEVDCEHCDGTGYMYPTSVEQEVAPPIREAMDGEEAVFHGAGREDVDALMVGTGRPFVVEVKRPRRRNPDTEILAAEINESDVVEVENLQLATHRMVERVKELDASKSYRAETTFGEPVEEAALGDALGELDGATVEQYTPERVDHRRASLTRTREVYEADGELIGETTAELRFHTEGGTYVKELVSGDDGRTEPSVAGLLGVDAEVTALDVTAVEAEEGRFAEDEFLRDGDEDE